MEKRSEGVDGKHFFDLKRGFIRSVSNHWWANSILCIFSEIVLTIRLNVDRCVSGEVDYDRACEKNSDEKDSLLFAKKDCPE